MTRGIRKGLRTLLQAIAGGGLTALVVALVGHVDPVVQTIVMGAWTAIIAFAQNSLESSGTIPVLLPSPPLTTTEGGDTSSPGPIVENLAQSVVDQAEAAPEADV